MAMKLQSLIGLVILAGIVGGCGVKGDPVPPGTAAEIGRGKPKFNSLDSDETSAHKGPLSFPQKKPGESEPDDE